MIFLEDAVVILNLLEERNSNAPQGSLKWVTRRSAAAGAVCKKRSLPQHTPPRRRVWSQKTSWRLFEAIKSIGLIDSKLSCAAMVWTGERHNTHQRLFDLVV